MRISQGTAFSLVSVLTLKIPTRRALWCPRVATQGGVWQLQACKDSRHGGEHFHPVQLWYSEGGGVGGVQYLIAIESCGLSQQIVAERA